MTHKIFGAWGAVLFFVTTASSQVAVPLTVETNTSSAKLTLTVQGQTSSDTQSLGGSMTLGMDCFSPLSAASLRDFHLEARHNFNLHLAFGFFGDLFVTVTNLQILHADPGPHRSSEPISAGAISFHETPTLLGGRADYVATGIPCLVLQDSGLLCEDTVSLADQPPTSISELSGTITVTNGAVQFVGNFNFGPVEVASGATVSGEVRFSARGSLQPCLRIGPGESAGEHQVSWSTFLGNYALVCTTALIPGAIWSDAIPLRASESGGTTNAVFVNAPGNFFYRLEARGSATITPR